MNKFILAIIVSGGVLYGSLYGAMVNDTVAAQLMDTIVSEIGNQHAFKLRDALERLNKYASDPDFNVNYQCQKEGGMTLSMLLLGLEKRYANPESSAVVVVKSLCNICIKALFCHPRFNPNTENTYGGTALTLAVLDGRVDYVEMLLGLRANVRCMTAKDSAGRTKTERCIGFLDNAWPLARLLDYVEIWAALIASGLQYNPKEFGSETLALFQHNPMLCNVLEVIQKNPSIAGDALRRLRYMGRLGVRDEMWKLVYEKLASALHQTRKHCITSIGNDEAEEKKDDDDIVKQPATKKQKPNDPMDEDES